MFINMVNDLVISSMRVYAIWGRDKRAFFIVLAVSLIAPVINLVCYPYIEDTLMEQISF